MNLNINIVLKATAFAALLFLISTTELVANKLKGFLPVKVIIDTDLDSDADDVGALAMLYNLHHAGEIELLGVIVTSDDLYAPVCAAALNTFYKLPKLPVGFLKNQTNLRHHSRYTKQIAEEFHSGMESWKDAGDAINLYRSILAQQPDESVVVVTVGHLSSFQGLLQSEPDEVSRLDGKELAHLKIREWVCMGGQYPEGKEANFYRPDPGSTVYSISNWNKEIVFCGWEAGNLVMTGGNELKGKLAPGHPVYRGYELYNGFAGRQSWDQLAVLQLIKKGRKYFSAVKGRCIVAPDGSNTWQKDKDGLHRYIVLAPGKDASSVKRLVDGLMAGEVKGKRE